MKKFLFYRPINLLVFFLCGITIVRAQTPVAKNGQLKVVGTKLVNQYGNPIQLRGMSTHGIQWLGNCLTDASLDVLANEWGADVLRVSLYTAADEDGYVTNPSGLTAQASRLVDKATERGMYAIIDWHQLNDNDPYKVLAQAKTYFTAMANAHKNKNNIFYEICNEPSKVSWSRIKDYANQIIPVIRAIDNDAVILVGTRDWSSFGLSDDGSAQEIVNSPVNFPNIMYTFHFYAASHDSRYLNELDWASDRLPVFVTEFGTQNSAGEGSNNFTRSQQYIDLMRRKKISWTNWNYSDDPRTGAVWKEGTCGNGPWTVARLKPAGVWVRERIMTPADDFPTGPVTPTCEPVKASSNDGNVPANVRDNDLNTRWSAKGDNEWIEFCLSASTTVTGVDIAFFQGNARRSRFDILTSTDGTSWSAASSGLQSSGTSLNLESFTFTARTAKYVRIVGHGNSTNDWNSYTEVKIKNGSSTVQRTAEAVPGKPSEKPAAFTLNSYPNPVSSTAAVQFSLPEAGRVQLAVYDISGKVVQVLANGRLAAGAHNTVFESGKLPAGIYLLKLEHGGKTLTRRISKQ